MDFRGLNIRQKGENYMAEAKKDSQEKTKIIALVVLALVLLGLIVKAFM
jgi:hypothetical protein